MKNIALVGFMGTGKSVIAKRISRRLKMKYVSTDSIIEAKEKRPINEIFTKDGEPYFRIVEREAVREVSAMENCVVAAGGGVVLNEDNMADLRKGGIIVCLNASAKDVYERTKSYANRPLLNVPDPLAKIKELMDKRELYYKKADYQVETSSKTVDEVVDEVIAIWERA
ncbi:MAG: shikimate kinase [Candidatus Omnitrophota bacterium]